VNSGDYVIISYICAVITIGGSCMIKRCKKYSLLLLFGLISAGVFACNKKPEAVIGDGEDITQTSVEYPTLAESKATKFTYKDLSMGNVTYLMTETQVTGIMGKPSEIRDTEAGRVYSYNESTILFEKLDQDNKVSKDGTYKVTMVASVGDKEKFARGLKVGNTVDDILNAYYRDADYQNNAYMSEDKTTTIGKFLYGNFTMAELDNVKTKDEISYGLVNFNGYKDVETAESYIIEFTYFDNKYIGDRATVDDDFATLSFEIDNTGKITTISWYYYPQEK